MLAFHAVIDATATAVVVSSLIAAVVAITTVLDLFLITQFHAVKNTQNIFSNDTVW